MLGGSAEFVVAAGRIGGRLDFHAKSFGRDTASVERLADPSAAPLLVRDEHRIEGGGHTYRQQDSTKQGEFVLRMIVVEGLAHAWSGGNMNYEFNDSNGPDASRLIFDFVMAYRTQRASNFIVG